MVGHHSRALDPDAIDLGALVDERFEVVERLGAGGFANVFKARDRFDPSRFVALKVLHADPRVRNDPNFRARFEREARLAARIAHPNVVGILGHGLAGPLEQPYIAMEFLEGYDLGFMLEQEGRFDARRALHLLLPCLEALGRGHAQGIVHKDLKPGNLFVTHPGTAHEVMKVLDFGIARRDAPGERKITQAGELLGTPEYLAPEYIDQALVSPALDVYQMGLILGEMLVGKPLAAAESAIGSIIRHNQGIALPPALRDTPLRQVLETAIARDPARRYPDAERFRRALAPLSPDAIEHALQLNERSQAPSLARPDTVPSNVFDRLSPDELERLLAAGNPQQQQQQQQHALDLGFASTLAIDDYVPPIAEPSAAAPQAQPVPRSPAPGPVEQHFAETRPHMTAFHGSTTALSNAPNRTRTVLAVVLAVVLAAAALAAAVLMTGCSGCSERSVNPDSAEDAARIWGKLLCDMRESRVTLYINDFDNQHGTAMVRAQLLAGDDGKARARFLGELNDFVEDNGRAIVTCSSDILDQRTVDGGRVQVDLAIEYREVGFDEDGDPELVTVRHELTLETTKIDDVWRVTAEPVDAPKLDDFHLIHRERGRAVP